METEYDYKTVQVWHEAYHASLQKHIAAVQEAGRRIGVNLDQLVEHDKSKWTNKEFHHYARQFHGDAGDPNGFAGAWLNHVHNNKHHPEFWRFPSTEKIRGADIVNRCLPMPENFILEHIADLMGSSFCYTGSWEMHDWLSKNMKNLFYHPQSADFMRLKLSELGYKEIVVTHQFGNELTTQ